MFQTPDMTGLNRLSLYWISNQYSLPFIIGNVGDCKRKWHGCLFINSYYHLPAEYILYLVKYTHEFAVLCFHDNVIKCKHFPRYWPFVRGIHRSPVNYPYRGQWRGALMFSFICVWINIWVNNREASDLRRYRAHYDVILMYCGIINGPK